MLNGASCLSAPPVTALAVTENIIIPRRLAYGTDQGRWLQQQVAQGDNGPKRRTRPQHVFHPIDSLEPSAASAAPHSSRPAIEEADDTKMFVLPGIIGGIMVILLFVFLLTRYE
jgi:hypothetical protein